MSSSLVSRALSTSASIPSSRLRSWRRMTLRLGLVTGCLATKIVQQSLAATNEVCTIPVYRPLIGFDKLEIVEVAQRIGTFETSILPYEDCCTVFTPRHPRTKPRLHQVLAAEQALDEEALIAQAMENIETIVTYPQQW